MIMLSFCILCILFSSCISLQNEYFQVDITNWNNYDTLTSELKTRYKPTWESLDNRPLPTWYDEAKFGIFLHWGVFSVPSFGSEWFWHSWREKKDIRYLKFMKERYPPRFTYQDFGPEFTAEFFNPTQWSEIFEASGAKYIVLTSKHHEGYTLWPSSYSFSWNAMDVGPQKDLIGELAAAVRKTKLKFGLYHSLYEWFNPLYLKDKENNFTTNTFVTNKIMPELHELVEKYRPEVVWSDGDWEASDSYWKSKEFLSWLYNDSPVKDTVVANDRWGRNIPCHHGDIYTCTDRYNPGVLIKHKWENCMTIDKKSWGFRRNAVLSEYLTLNDLVKELVTTVSCGGNLLMNVGPSKDGTIAPIFEERLRGMGAWLKVNGEAIFNTIPWVAQNDTLTGTVWYTQSKNDKSVYASILNWPEDNVLRLGSVIPSENTQISLLGFLNQLKWKSVDNTLLVYLPVEAHQGQPGWVLKIKQ